MQPRGRNNNAHAIISNIHKDNNVIDSWGPRPATATKMVADYKEKNGVLDPEFKQDLQVWYNKDKGKSVQEDFVSLVKKF